MEPNVGTIERIIRIGGGILLVSVGFHKIGGFIGFLGGLWGADEIATGIVGWCPEWYLLNISTVEGAENNPFKAIKEALT
ncbi:MAG: DUF2892 domain-containing protein [Chloroflexi bacterium]|nr:DUF2892 domain-containing protein [Chloroflexota bacterium]